MEYEYHLYNFEFANIISDESSGLEVKLIECLVLMQHMHFLGEWKWFKTGIQYFFLIFCKTNIKYPK